jgi:NAD(P)-dependent dehydrogenase (short-subunit alcohol dehydrogenase family)
VAPARPTSDDPLHERRGQRVQPVLALRSLPDLHGEVAVVTGGTDGVGRAIAEQLCRARATVLVTARDPNKGDRVAREIRHAVTGADVEAITMDLADLRSVRSGVADIEARTGTIDHLIANAGHMAAGERATTAQGFERTFGVNHLGHAALLQLLDATLRATRARVVIVASEAHRRSKGGLDFADLMSESTPFRPKLAYNRSKLANILHTKALARRYAGSGVTVEAAHPGGVDTPMMRANFTNPVMRRLYPALRRTLFITPDDAAAGVLRVALDPDLAVRSGGYYECGAVKTPSAAACDDEAAERLWRVTEELIGPHLGGSPSRR